MDLHREAVCDLLHYAAVSNSSASLPFALVVYGTRCRMCRGGVIVYSIELSDETLSAKDGPYTLDLGAPPHDFAQACHL